MTKQIHRAKCHIVSPMRETPVKRHKWTSEEERALVEFISVAKTAPKYDLAAETEWPSFRDGHCFWTAAAPTLKQAPGPTFYQQVCLLSINNLFLIYSRFVH